MRAPRVSIITPSFQHGRFLEDTILSVLDQRYPNLEYFVLDGGSTDASVSILEKYSSSLTYWHSEPDMGQVHAVNEGLKRATGQILTWLNSDDFLLPGALEAVVQAYHLHPDAAGWCGGGYGIAVDGYVLGTRRPMNLAAESLANWTANWFYQPSCFFSAAIARKVGYLDTAYESAFDFEFWLRLSRLAELVPIPEILSATRVHAETKTVRLLRSMLEETMAIQRENGFEELTSATKAVMQQHGNQVRAGSVARLLYATATQRRKEPDRFVRLPSARIRDDKG